MKTIKDAVIELAGKLPNRTYTKYSNVAGWYISRCGKLTHAVDCVWFEPEEFESCAKRMGYINGYEWGKEYPTNGKRPELPDDVLVLAKLKNHHYKDEWSDVKRKVYLNVWDHQTTAFRIIDKRYKPVSETSLFDGDIPFAGTLTVEPAPQDNSWHERGELPPVGVECEFYFGTDHSPEWHRGAVTYRSDKFTVIIYADGEERCYELEELEYAKFRPIRTHREKVIEAAMKCCQAFPSTQLNFAEKLYDAGMLVLPTKKSDTED